MYTGVSYLILKHTDILKKSYELLLLIIIIIVVVVDLFLPLTGC